MTPLRSASWPARIVRAGSAAVVAVAVSLAAGCGDPAATKLVGVSGAVKHGGVPMPMGTVTYHPDAAKGNTHKAPVTGMIKPDGTYTLNTDGKPGAPAGWYQVTISGQGMPDMSMMKDGGKTPAPPAVNPKYAKPESSGFAVEVKDGAPAGAYDLPLVK